MQLSAYSRYVEYIASLYVVTREDISKGPPLTLPYRAGGIFYNFMKLFGGEFFLEAGIEYSMRSGCSWHSATNGHYARELLPEP